jgi:octanoyl-[GcvH]:protein N-octanoyltransferase
VEFRRRCVIANTVMTWSIRRHAPGLSAEADIDAEMALLDAALADPAQPILRLWRTHRSLVVTPLLAHKPRFQSAADASALRGWPVVVRRTGGGPVPQGPQTLSISLAAAMPRAQAPGIDPAFTAFAGWLCDALRACGLAPEVGEIAGSCCPGRYDIAVGGKKIIGIAQRRRLGRHGDTLLTAVLVHAMLWFEGNLDAGIDALERFLEEAGLPERFARDRMGTLEDVSASGVTAIAFEEALLRAGTLVLGNTEPSPHVG